ncbi:MAG: hypothetical protein EOP32_08985 [Rhodococcus sp. (in: high G+C Gram-positive bacteria)]|nr:MAG: hypothetical protein EOP32_08985 [Rhodococcus sp. (in: high G+C Gram-positive bacteria)]
MYANAPGVGAARTGGISARDRHVWELFADWCAANDLRTLPTAPHQLARFLRDNPAARATQRRRVSVINTVHHNHGHQAPGRAETIRRTLNTDRAERLQRISTLVARSLERIPDTGWPAGLFGRRDALILVLVATGLGFEQIAQLRGCDLTTIPDQDDALHITVAGEQLVASAAGESGTSAAAVCRRWTEVRGFLDRHPSTRLLADHLATGSDLTGYGADADNDDRPLLSSINRWGHTPLVPTPMTARAVAAIAHAHLSGRAPAHTLPPRRPRPEPIAGVAPIESDLILDPDYYERGIQARHFAYKDLGDITDVLGDVEDRADQLLADLLEILDDDAD